MTVTRVTQLPRPPARPPDAHKGTFGRVLLIGGSRGMSGAVCLSGLAALRGGAGLVLVGVPQGIVPIVASVELSYLTIPLPEDDAGRIAPDAWTALEPRIRESDAIAIGPGLGRSEGLESLLRRVLESSAAPLVVDADGLNALARLPDVWAAQAAAGGTPRTPWVLTPHPGEFARLTGGGPQSSNAGEREAAAIEFARARNIVLVLKGHRSVITDGARVAINQTGNSGMATGGTGDVLTGLIASLLAQGMPAFEAAQLGAHLHGLAGDFAAAELSEPGLIASDLPRYLCQAWKALP